jgi:Lon protease-like protein
MSATRPQWLPLFPLRAVLLPGALLPLHIFEPRYQALMRRCESTSTPFSVVLAQEDKLAAVGCEALIHQILQRYPDGQTDLLVRGGERVGLLGIREHPDGYLEAETEVVQDQPEAEDPAGRRNLLELFAAYRKLVEEGGAAEAEEGAWLRSVSEAMSRQGYTFLLAAASALSLEERQQLLETVSEHARELTLLRHLTQQVQIQSVQTANIGIVRGNGKLTPSP